MKPNERMVPCDVEAEEAVLGSILIDPDAVDLVAPIVRPGDFYREVNGWIYDACLALSDRWESINQITVAHELEQRERLAEVGGVGFLAQLVAMTPTSVHAADYADIVAECATKRRLISAGTKIAEAAYGGDKAVDLVAWAFEILMSMAESTTSQGLRSFREIAAELAGWDEAYLADPRSSAGTSTKLSSLDNAIGGLKPGYLYVVAGRPSMGKTQLLLSLAVNVALQGKTVAFFTLEMPRRDNWRRCCLTWAGLSDDEIRRGVVPLGWQDKFREARQELRELPIHMDDSSRITTGTIRARTAQLKRRYPDLAAVFVDYAQILGDEARENETQRVSDLTTSLKHMALHLDVPMIAAYQLSRAVEGRDTRVPLLSDLRQSGQIEQDADVVAMLYRKAYYHEREPQNVRFLLQPGQEHLLEVLIEKHRNGPTGKADLHYDTSTGRITAWPGPEGENRG